VIFLSNAVIPRLQGDDYQACYFWIKACEMFHSHTKVTKIAFEHDEIKSFDDVVSFYDPPIRDPNGDLIYADYYQLKFHATQNGAFTWKNLMNPAFINAKSVSFLERLRNGQQQAIAQGYNYRFYIVSPWVIDPSDPLSKIVSNNSGELRMDKLFDGSGHRSEMGKVRVGWCSHLELQSEDGLKEVLQPLRIISNYRNIEGLLKDLNRELCCVQLKPIENGSLINPYSNLIQNLLKNGRKEFTKNELLQICKEENLWIGCSKKAEPNKVIGIRSFYRWAENMENETESMLCLLKYFDGRYIKAGVSWNKDIVPEIERYLTSEICSGEKIDIHLDAHSSIAFVVGYCLDPKSGVDVAPVQRNNKREVWRPDKTKTIRDYPDWESDIIVQDNNATDMAVAIGIRHNIVEEVEAYLITAGLSVNEIFSYYPNTGAGAAAIIDGTHAYLLADRIVSLLRKQMLMKKKGRLHVFVAAPNAFCFFLGQLSRVLGQITFYEYDFENGKTGSYSPAVSLPLTKK
jgi:hypothetical protein